MKTRTKIQRAIKVLPGLTDYGNGIPGWTPIRQRSKKLKVEKSRLLESEERFESACQWLQNIDKTEVINTINSSYYLKHIAERRIGGHLSNGVFIAAAIHCGFSYQTARNFPNVVFNMDEDSLQEKYEESLLYEKYPKETRALVQ